MNWREKLQDQIAKYERNHLFTIMDFATATVLHFIKFEGENSLWAPYRPCDVEDVYSDPYHPKVPAAICIPKSSMPIEVIRGLEDEEKATSPVHTAFLFFEDAPNERIVWLDNNTIRHTWHFLPSVSSESTHGRDYQLASKLLDAADSEELYSEKDEFPNAARCQLGCYLRRDTATRTFFLESLGSATSARPMSLERCEIFSDLVPGQIADFYFNEKTIEVAIRLNDIPSIGRQVPCLYFQSSETGYSAPTISAGWMFDEGDDFLTPPYFVDRFQLGRLKEKDANGNPINLDQAMRQEMSDVILEAKKALRASYEELQVLQKRSLPADIPVSAEGGRIMSVVKLQRTGCKDYAGDKCMRRTLTSLREDIANELELKEAILHHLLADPDIADTKLDLIQQKAGQFLMSVRPDEDPSKALSASA